jgi:hypothetical protein
MSLIRTDTSSALPVLCRNGLVYSGSAMRVATAAGYAQTRCLPPTNPRRKIRSQFGSGGPPRPNGRERLDLCAFRF